MLRRALRSLLNLDEPPERTALAFAVGTLIGFSPLLGLHTILAALVAVVLRLNKTAVLTGSLLNNPWTIAPIIAASWGIGRMLLGAPQVDLPQTSLGALLSAEFWRTLAGQWRQLLPFAVGSTLLAFAMAILSYPLMLYSLRAYRRKYLSHTTKHC